METQKNKRIYNSIGIVSSILGLYICAQSTGIMPIDSTALHAPLGVFFLIGIVFLTAGVMILLGINARANNLLAFLFLMSFGVSVFWVAFFSPPNTIAGGIPFLPEGYGDLLNRSVFGVLSVLCFSLSIYALRSYFKRNT